MSLISNITSYIGRNKLGVTLIAAAAGLLAATALISGCSLGDVIKVAVPPEVQKVTQSAPKVSLNDAADVRDKYVQDVSRSLARFDSDIGKADALRNIFADLLNTGITIGQDSLANSGFPMGGALAMALGGLGGLFMEKPGSKAKAASDAKVAEDKGFDMGHATAVQTLSTAIATKTA